MSCQLTQIYLGALLGALTVLLLMVIFLALCIIMRAVAYVLSSVFDEVLKRMFPDESMLE